MGDADTVFEPTDDDYGVKSKAQVVYLRPAPELQKVMSPSLFHGPRRTTRRLSCEVLVHSYVTICTYVWLNLADGRPQ